MSTIKANSIFQGNDGSVAELTEEDKTHIQLLVSLQCIAESKCPRSMYECKQKCLICSEGEPNFQADENSRLFKSRLVARNKNNFLSKEDREAINKDLLHGYFKKKFDVENEKMKISQTETLKTYGHSNKCVESDSRKTIFPNERKENNKLGNNTHIQAINLIGKSCVAKTLEVKHADQRETHDGNKIMLQEGANRLDETKAAGDVMQIDKNKSKQKESHIRSELEGGQSKSTERKGDVLGARSKEENECDKNKPQAKIQNDQLDEKAVRLRRMKEKLKSALTNWNKIKLKESQSSVLSERGSLENVNRKEEGNKKQRYDYQDAFVTNQQEAERKKTDPRRDRSEDRKELVPFNGPPMDDPKGKFYIDRELADVPMYQHGLKYEKWNPTQCLYELSSKCGWSWPLFTVTRVDKTSLIPSYVCEATINGETFKTDRGAAQKKFAQHMASTKIMKYIGFDFEFHCQKI